MILILEKDLKMCVHSKGVGVGALTGKGKQNKFIKGQLFKCKREETTCDNFRVLDWQHHCKNILLHGGNK